MMFNQDCDNVMDSAEDSCAAHGCLEPATTPDAGVEIRELMSDAIAEFGRRWEAGEAPDVVAFAKGFPRISDPLIQALNAQLVFEEHPDVLDCSVPEAVWPHQGEVFLGLRLEREISRGSFGRVFRGTEPALGNRAVAVKVAPFGDHEARTLGRLEHRNIVPVYSIQQDEETGLTAVCMPYLGSVTLQDVLHRVHAERLPVRGTTILDALRSKAPLAGAVPSVDPVLGKGSYVRGIVHLGAQIADALAYAHARGIAHLDLKPSNVLLTAEGSPMLVDFHLALDTSADTVRLGGTVPYTSPEQLEVIDQELAARAEGRDSSQSALVPPNLPPVTDSADIFSLGVMLYELLAGFNPFVTATTLTGREQVAHVRQRQQQGPRPLHLVNPQVDAGLALLVDRCLALEPAERPSARELAGRLRRSQRGLRPLLSRCAVPLVCALVLLLPTFVAGGVWLSRHTARVRATPAQEGKTAFAQGLYEVAEARFKKALEQDPQSAELLLWLGRTETRLGNLIEAEAYYKKADTLSARGDVQACRAYNLLLMGEDSKLGVSYPEQALQESRRALASGFESAELHNNLAWSAMLRARYDEADKSLQRAIELAPDFQGAYLSHLALELYQTNRDTRYLPLRGVADLRRALELGPVAAECYFYGAILCAEIAARANGRADVNGADHSRLAQTYLRQAIEKGYRLDIVQQHPRLSGLLASLPNPPRAKVTADKVVCQMRFFDPLRGR